MPYKRRRRLAAVRISHRHGAALPDTQIQFLSANAMRLQVAAVSGLVLVLRSCNLFRLIFLF